MARNGGYYPASQWRGIGERLSATQRDGTGRKFPGRDVVENQRWGIAPSVAFGLNTPTRFIVNYLHLEQDNLSDYGIPWVPATNNVLVDFRDRP